MEKSKSNQLIVLVAFVAPFVLVFLGCWIWKLQAELDLVRYENTELRGTLQQQVACPSVHVTCECPDYEEGWDDAEHASGCDPEEISMEDLQAMCGELEAFGYVPGC